MRLIYSLSRKYNQTFCYVHIISTNAKFFPHSRILIMHLETH